jgi:transketolase
VLSDVEGTPDLVLIATGSEVNLALQVQDKLAAEHGIRARVVSMPCWELFMEQSLEYQNQVLPPQVTARMSMEAGCSLGWERWVGSSGDMVSVDRFGASAPGSEVLKQYGFSVEAVCGRAVKLVRG